MDLEGQEVSKSHPKEVHVRNEDREERGSRWTVGKSCRQAVQKFRGVNVVTVFSSFVALLTLYGMSLAFNSP